MAALYINYFVSLFHFSSLFLVYSYNDDDVVLKINYFVSFSCPTRQLPPTPPHAPIYIQIEIQIAFFLARGVTQIQIQIVANKVFSCSRLENRSINPVFPLVVTDFSWPSCPILLERE